MVNPRDIAGNAEEEEEDRQKERENETGSDKGQIRVKAREK